MSPPPLNSIPHYSSYWSRWRMSTDMQEDSSYWAKGHAIPKVTTTQHVHTIYTPSQEQYLIISHMADRMKNSQSPYPIAVKL